MKNKDEPKICAGCGWPIHLKEEDYIVVDGKVYHERCANGCPTCL